LTVKRSVHYLSADQPAFDGQGVAFRGGVSDDHVNGKAFRAI